MLENLIRPRAFAILKQRKLKVIPRGVAWQVCGHGVDLMVADLWSLSPVDLFPPEPRAVKSLRGTPNANVPDL